jgi:hypothetical protein
MAKPARQSMRDRMKEQAEKSQSHGPSYIKIPADKKNILLSTQGRRI